MTFERTDPSAAGGGKTYVDPLSIAIGRHPVVLWIAAVAGAVDLLLVGWVLSRRLAQHAGADPEPRPVTTAYIAVVLQGLSLLTLSQYMSSWGQKMVVAAPIWGPAAGSWMPESLWMLLAVLFSQLAVLAAVAAPASGHQRLRRLSIAHAVTLSLTVAAGLSLALLMPPPP